MHQLAPTSTFKCSPSQRIQQTSQASIAEKSPLNLLTNAGPKERFGLIEQPSTWNNRRTRLALGGREVTILLTQIGSGEGFFSWGRVQGCLYDSGNFFCQAGFLAFGTARWESRPLKRTKNQHPILDSRCHVLSTANMWVLSLLQHAKCWASRTWMRTWMAKKTDIPILGIDMCLDVFAPASTVGTNSLNTTIWQHGIHRIWISLLMFPCISIVRTTTLSFPRAPRLTHEDSHEKNQGSPSKNSFQSWQPLTRQSPKQWSKGGRCPLLPEKMQQVIDSKGEI